MVLTSCSSVKIDNRELKFGNVQISPCKVWFTTNGNEVLRQEFSYSLGILSLQEPVSYDEGYSKIDFNWVSFKGNELIIKVPKLEKSEKYEFLLCLGQISPTKGAIGQSYSVGAKIYVDCKR